MPRAQLALALSHLPPQHDPRILVGMNTADDAGVIRIAADRALVQTVDVFAPVVNDPYTFGQIAAVNSLSDIYAMGGTPMAALNVVGFPMALPPEVLGEILRGGQDVATAAGVAMLGGHTFQDAEIRYGLAVTGEIHPDRIITNAGAQPGDKLVLTKPLGTGTIIQALISRGIVAESIYQAAIDSMTTLNDVASRVMIKYAHACTDITGFGFAGHCSELAEACGFDLEIHCRQIPTLEQSLELIREGIVEAGVKQNRNSFESKISFAEHLPQEYQILLYSSETSGGLLIAVSDKDCQALCRDLNSNNSTAAVVGEILCRKGGTMSIKE